MNVVVNTIKDILKINIRESNISVAHRMSQYRVRHMIVKLVNRSQKYQIVGACIKTRPNLYINESLTPNHLSLLKQVLAIRKQHRQKFQQCFTKDGKIIIKLKTPQ